MNRSVGGCARVRARPGVCLCVIVSFGLALGTPRRGMVRHAAGAARHWTVRWRVGLWGCVLA